MGHESYRLDKNMNQEKIQRLTDELNVRLLLGDTAGMDRLREDIKEAKA